MVSLGRRRNAAAAAERAAEEVAAAATRARIEHRARQAQLDPFVKLRQIQKELQQVNEQATDEILKTEKKYKDKRKLIYARRNQIISDIPCFWLIAFMNNFMLQNLLREDDQEIFCYLDSVNVEDFAYPRKGYVIAFNFRDNPFFSNKILTKTINFLNDGTLRSFSIAIDWKASKGPDVGNSKEKGSRRPLPVDSFFSWFCSPEEDKEAEVEKALVAKIFKEEIWPNPIHRLLSILDGEVDFDYEEYDDEEYDDEDNEDEEEDNTYDRDRDSDRK